MTKLQTLENSLHNAHFEQSSRPMVLTTSQVRTPATPFAAKVSPLTDCECE